MQQQESFGRLSLVDEENSSPTLLLDEVPVVDGQLVCAKRGVETIPGRIRLHPEGYWLLDHREFIGHTYLNIPLRGSWLDDLTVTLVE